MKSGPLRHATFSMFWTRGFVLLGLGAFWFALEGDPMTSVILAALGFGVFWHEYWSQKEPSQRWRWLVSFLVCAYLGSCLVMSSFEGWDLRGLSLAIVVVGCGAWARSLRRFRGLLPADLVRRLGFLWVGTGLSGAAILGLAFGVEWMAPLVPFGLLAVMVSLASALVYFVFRTNRVISEVRLDVPPVLDAGERQVRRFVSTSGFLVDLERGELHLGGQSFSSRGFALSRVEVKASSREVWRCRFLSDRGALHAEQKVKVDPDALGLFLWALQRVCDDSGWNLKTPWSYSYGGEYDRDWLLGAREWIGGVGEESEAPCCLRRLEEGFVQYDLEVISGSVLLEKERLRALDFVRALGFAGVLTFPLVMWAREAKTRLEKKHRLTVDGEGISWGEERMRWEEISMSSLLPLYEGPVFLIGVERVVQICGLEEEKERLAFARDLVVRGIKARRGESLLLGHELPQEHFYKTPRWEHLARRAFSLAFLGAGAWVLVMVWAQWWWFWHRFDPAAQTALSDFYPILWPDHWFLDDDIRPLALLGLFLVFLGWSVGLVRRHDPSFWNIQAPNVVLGGVATFLVAMILACGMGFVLPRPGNSILPMKMRSAQGTGLSLEGTKGWNQGLGKNAYVSLTGSNLRRADFSGSYLYGADFRRSDLSSANFEWSSVGEFVLEGATCHRAWMRSVSGQSLQARGVQCRGSSWDSVRFKRGDFSGADLSGASLAGVFFEDLNLEGANLEGADFTGALMLNVNLKGAKTDGLICPRGGVLGENYTACVRDPGFVWSGGR